jgi:hypothetical protein
MAESSGAEMHSYPDPALLVFENVHIVVAATNRSELRSGHIPQRGRLPKSRAVRSLRDLPGIIVVVVEQLVIDRFLVLAGKPEGDRVADVIHDAPDVRGPVGIGEDGLLPHSMSYPTPDGLTSVSWAITPPMGTP